MLLILVISFHFQMTVWEVRRSSVMTLREILTHQGASAGVFMPDLSWDGALYIELEDKGISYTMKRERESLI